MPKNQPKPIGSIKIDFFPNETRVEITRFHKLTPAKIQSSYPVIMEKWGQLRQAAVLDHRKRQNEETEDAA